MHIRKAFKANPGLMIASQRVKVRIVPMYSPKAWIAGVSVSASQLESACHGRCIACETEWGQVET